MADYRNKDANSWDEEEEEGVRGYPALWVLGMSLSIWLVIGSYAGRITDQSNREKIIQSPQSIYIQYQISSTQPGRAKESNLGVIAEGGK